MARKSNKDKAIEEHRSLTREANAAWLKATVSKRVEAPEGTVSFSEFAAEKQLKHKHYDFSFPGRSRAKFLAGKSYQEIMDGAQTPGSKSTTVKSGDIELTKAQAKVERESLPRIDTIEQEYMKNRNIPVSKPVKKKKSEPTLMERTKVNRTDLA